MEVLAIEWLVVFIQNYIWEIALDVKKGFFTKWKFKGFQKELDASLSEFCNRNECVYLNSSAFQYFIEHFGFVEDIVSRATATKINKSNKEFLRDYIKIARSVAESEEIVFGHEEERLIKDLYKLINDKTTDFFSKMLSAEQRIIISKTINGIAELRDEVRDYRNDADNKFMTINESLQRIAKLSESQENIIAELIFKSIWENDFETLEKLNPIIDGKSLSLEEFLKAVVALINNDDADLSISQITGIENSFVRDLAIKTLLPIYIFKKSKIGTLETTVTAPALYEIVHAVNTGEYESVFEEKIDDDQGTEIHSFSLNKKMLCEEKWLTKQVVLLYLYELPIRNVSSAMREIIGEEATWLNKLLIADKYIDAVSNENPSTIDKSMLRSMVIDAKKSTGNTEKFAKILQILYFSVLLKAEFILSEDTELENTIPETIRECSPIDAFLFMKKIERHECDLEEVYQFSERTGAYWLLNNFFINIQKPNVLIGFCKKNELIFEKNPLIFFLFTGALKAVGAEKDRKNYLKKYKYLFRNYYEFWNELLELDLSDDDKQEFVDICRAGNIGFVFSESEALLIERLLQLQEYSLAAQNIHRMELKGENNYKVKKYKAIIEQSKGNQVEALNLFKEAFDDKKLDSYVVDSVITISLVNNRRVEEKYIKAAEAIGTSRLFMLAAAAYKNNGDDLNVKLANKKAMLRSKDQYCNAFGQFLTFDLHDKSDSVQKINGIEVNTCAECKDDSGTSLFVCIEGDLVLPESPYMWQGNLYMYKEDAAEAGILRRHTGETIDLNGRQYVIEAIIPLDAYYFRLCLGKMEKAGVAQTISIPTRDGNLDISVFKDWILKNSQDEKSIFDWLQQYNNMGDVPLSLYTYKRFARASYLQFVDLIFDDKNIFIRECKGNYKKAAENSKYVLTFSAALMLYKIGFPADKLRDNKIYITASTMMQVNSDCMKIIEEYDREDVTSMGVYEGRIFLNQTGEEKKDYWIKEAGKIKKYFSTIQQVDNSNDVKGEFLTKIEAKELLGICDYDAIAIAQTDSNFVLVTLEAIHRLISENNDVNIDCINLVDLISEINITCIEQLRFIKNILNYGCLYSLNGNILQLVSEELQLLPDEKKKKIYLMIDEIMKSLDCFEERIKLLSIQSIAEEVTSLQNEGIVLDNDLMHLLTMNILLLKRQKLEIAFDDSGHLVSYLRDMTEEEKQSAMIAFDSKGK